MASYIRRRKFLATLGSAAAAWPLAARAQQPEKVRRVGILMPFAPDDPEARLRVAALEQGLRDLGWVDSRNLRIDYRWAVGDPGRFHRYAAVFKLITVSYLVGVCTGRSAGFSPLRIRST